MATNHMAEVAKMLDVELDEEFEIVFPQPSNCKAIAKLTQNGINVVETNIFDAYNFKTYLLKDLLIGSYTIKRKPWKPKKDEKYWCVGMNELVHCYCFNDDIIDFYHIKLGNCYRTKEEAEANKDKWIAFYNSDDVLEV